MSWRTNRIVVTLRNLGRRLGLNKRISSLVQASGYEARYDEGLSSCIRDGDCVWDVGANVGHYTRAFAERVGVSGTVVAFEPSAVNFERLSRECEPLGNVTALRCGLGSTDGTLSFQQGTDALGATSHVAMDGKGGEVVSIRSGDSLLAEGAVAVPNAIKIDVEGYEWEVLEGCAGVLRYPGLRAVGIEVHFGVLKERGLSHVPQLIEGTLDVAGFSMTWPDSSHILARRKA